MTELAIQQRKVLTLTTEALDVSQAQLKEANWKLEQSEPYYEVQPAARRVASPRTASSCLSCREGPSDTSSPDFFQPPASNSEL